MESVPFFLSDIRVDAVAVCRTPNIASELTKLELPVADTNFVTLESPSMLIRFLAKILASFKLLLEE